MLIRLMTVDDYDAVYALWSGTQGIGMSSVDDSREGIARYLCRNPSTSYVAQNGNEIIGVILCGHDGRRGFIYHTAVREDCRGQGVGKALVGAALEALQNEGISKAALVVFKTNEKGNRFWESHGFDTRGDLTYRNLSLNPLVR